MIHYIFNLNFKNKAILYDNGSSLDQLFSAKQQIEEAILKKNYEKIYK